MNTKEEFDKWYKEEGLDLCENIEKYFVAKAWQEQQKKIDRLKDRLKLHKENDELIGRME